MGQENTAETVGNMEGAILAGGSGRRLGRGPKAQVSVGGVRLLDRVLGALVPVCTSIRVVAKTLDSVAPLPSDVLFVPDEEETSTALLGVRRALELVPPDAAVLVVSCDHPFLSPSLLSLLGDSLRPDDLAVVPRDADRLHPLVAVYRHRPETLESLDRALRSGRLSVTRFAEGLSPRILSPAEWIGADPEGASFLNVNTEKDFFSAEERSKRSPS